ncbi:hypothetical protein BD309DRAFT_72291 [Dichomitus squalens]|nr:hypothetical protein BD309DRAFT_72291 [Dichomitus squalens]
MRSMSDPCEMNKASTISDSNPSLLSSIVHSPTNMLRPCQWFMQNAEWKLSPSEQSDQLRDPRPMGIDKNMELVYT